MAVVDNHGMEFGTAGLRVIEPVRSYPDSGHSHATGCSWLLYYK